MCLIFNALFYKIDLLHLKINKNNIDMLDEYERMLFFERMYYRILWRPLNRLWRTSKPEFSQYYINQILVCIPLDIEFIAINVDYY